MRYHGPQCWANTQPGSSVPTAASVAKNSVFVPGNVPVVEQGCLFLMVQDRVLLCGQNKPHDCYNECTAFTHTTNSSHFDNKSLKTVNSGLGRVSQCDTDGVFGSVVEKVSVYVRDMDLQKLITCTLQVKHE